MPSFTIFPDLPKELRLKIWAEICSVERVLPILPGKGHLAPRTHKYLAVPPPLHVCAESRYIALQHYGLRFHPRIYTNPERDTAMLHITYPRQRIDKILYLHSKGQSRGFSWDALPRIAVFLDDIGFHKVTEQTSTTRTDPPPSLYYREWYDSLTRPETLLPFDDDFMMSLYGFPYSESFAMRGPREVMFLILPPLTARPNPVIQRIELVGLPGESAAAHGLQVMETFYGAEFLDRVREHVFSWQRDDNWTPPKLTMRYATCTSWESTTNSFAELGEEEKWREVEPEVPRTTPKTDEEEMEEERQLEALSHHNTLEDAIGADHRMLFEELYDREQGLGPNVLWSRSISYCGTGMMSSPYSYDAIRVLLWEDELTEDQATRYLWMGGISTYRQNGLKWGQY
jgi:hypothetical protein